MPTTLEIWREQRRQSQHNTIAVRNVEIPSRPCPRQPNVLDFLWVYWDGGRLADELRWSMRSVRANYQGASRLIVVGDRPSWFDGEVIPAGRVEPCPHRPQRDTLAKMRLAIDSPRIDETLAWMMDDTYLIRPVSFDELAMPRHQGRLRTAYGNKVDYQRVKTVTCQALRMCGLRDAFDWATHLPHLVHTPSFDRLWHKYLLDRQTLLWEILYGAEVYVNGVHYAPFFRRIPRKSFVEPRNASIINNSASGWSTSLQMYLSNLFPQRIEEEADRPCRCA